MKDRDHFTHDRELEVLGWTTDGDETALICRLGDGSAGMLPARWTDLPWRLLLERGERLRTQRPPPLARA